MPTKLITEYNNFYSINVEDGNKKVLNNFKRHHKGSSIRKLRFWDNLLFSAAKTIKVTDLNTLQVTRKLDNDKAKIYSLLVADNYLVCAGDDEGNFKAWDYRVDRPIHMSLCKCEGFISDLDIDSTRRIVVASSGEGTLTAFNLGARKMEEPQSELFDSGFQCVRFAEEKHKVVVGSEDGVLNIFNQNQWGNISDRFPVKQNKTGECSIDCMEMFGEENFLVMGCSDGSLQAVSLFPNKALNVISKFNAGVESCDVHQINKQVVATSEDNVKVFSYEIIKSERKVKRLKKGKGFFDDLDS